MPLTLYIEDGNQHIERRFTDQECDDELGCSPDADGDILDEAARNWVLGLEYGWSLEDEADRLDD